MNKLSYLSNTGLEYMEGLYEQFKTDPNSLENGWQRFFEGFELGASKTSGNGHSTNGLPKDSEQLLREINVLNLIAGYRSRGHLFAKTNPILPNNEVSDLKLANFGLTDKDLDDTFQAGSELGLGRTALKNIVLHLENTYCRSIGVEYKYIRIPEIIKWLETRMEPAQNSPNFDNSKKEKMLFKIGQATRFEGFLQRKFPGQKRFSLEGAEAIIPALDGIIEYGSEIGVAEFVIGMAHRGRLNVLTSIMQKEYDNVFSEFEGKGLSDSVFDGDVKYHMGFSSNRVLESGKSVHLSLAPNPSHLEAVNPVVAGIARAKMDAKYSGNHDKICPILIHGDASLAGQGILYELIQMSRLPAYQVGGTIHIVINNQVGFTTDPADSRSSTYCTDVGKVTLSPVFHVNGDDVEAVVHTTKLAMAFRQEFNRDVFIDIVCYRKYGHNEGDEPRFTQPLMYDIINKHPDPYAVYTKKLLDENSITQDKVKEIEKQIDDHLNSELDQAKSTEEYKINTELKGSWAGLQFHNNEVVEPNPNTAVAEKQLKLIADKISKIPSGFNAHKTIEKILAQRLQYVESTEPKIDWGTAEHLAWGSLLLEGVPVRISGQDVERGTFSHRHAVIKDMKTEQKYTPLNNLSDKQMPLSVYNSLLSEFAVMGFEYGYATALPKGLTLWEAQYGDFVNGAQTIIDQFITSSKTKWQRMSGLVLLLPHGYEGGGPEHSSARMERFLQQCAQNNMYVVNITTPANYFHSLRRQVLTNYRRPMIVFSPKSLLRHPEAVSALPDLAKGKFNEVIDDQFIAAKDVTRVVFCTGKIYYDLLRQQQHFQKNNIAIVRLEQLYPFPEPQIDAILKKYKKAKDFIWCQEEPENMGAWTFIYYKFRTLMPLEVISRKESSSTAAGSMKQHNSQQQYILRKALELAPDAVLG